MSCKHDELDYINLFNLCWQHSDDLLLLLSGKLKILRINQVAEQLLGWSAREVLNKNIQIIFKEKAMQPFIPQNISTKENSTYVLSTHNNIRISWTITPTLDINNSSTLFFIVGKPEMKSSDEQFEIAQLETVVKFSPGLLYWKDKNSVYLGCNDEFAQLAGLNDRKEVKGKTDFDLVWKERANLYVEIDKAVIDSGVARLNHIEVISVSNNRTITAITNKVPMRDVHGKVLGVLGITTDITHQKEIELALSAAKEAAEAANIAKTEFIANMSHDLRTPLTGIIGLSTIIEDSTHNPDEKENAHWIHDSGEQLLSLLNGILDVVAAESLGEDDIRNESFDPRKLIEGIVQLELPTTKSKNLNLRVKIDNEVPTYIISDRMKLHRVLLNLLGNAIKFTKTGSITIKITMLDNTAADVHLQFDVADTGIGIPLELQDKVFDRFYRVTPSYKGTYTGHGIGLDIAQSYVNLLGGHITLTSQEGVGTTFHFDLPCKIGNKEDAVLEKNTVLAREEITLESNKPPTPAFANDTMTNKAPSADTNVPCILLVEDNPIALKVVESLVTATGCRFESVVDGEHALELATTHDFNLILTDIGLPGISGHEFTQRFREREKSLHKNPIPIVGLTAHARDAAIKECLLCGMDDVFSKPANLTMIQSMFAEYHIQDKRIETERTKPHEEAGLATPGKLGKDLPDTEDELFEMEAFLLFSHESALEQIQNKPLLYEQLNLFLSDDVQQDIRVMTAAYEQKDWSVVEKLAHKFKGGAGYLGLHRMVYACQYLERYYKAGHRNEDVLDKLYHQIMHVNEETIKTITDWLKNP